MAKLAAGADGALHLGVEQHIAAAALIARVHPRAVERDGIGAVQRAPQPQRVPGPQAPAGLLQRLRHIGEPQQKAHHLFVVAVHDEFHQVGPHDPLQVLRQEGDFPLGQGVVLPVVDEGLVVSPPHPRGPVAHIAARAQGDHPQVIAPPHPLGHTPKPFGHPKSRHFGRVGEEIHFLAKAQALQMVRIVGVVVVHHGHHLTMLEPLHQQAIAVEGGKTFGPHQRIQPPAAGPIRGGLHQGRDHLGVVSEVQKVEVGLASAVIGVEARVFQHRDAAHHLRPAIGQEEIGLGMLIKRVLVALQRQPGVGPQRRHPLRAVAVQSEHERDERALLGAGAHGDDSNAHDSTSSGGGGRDAARGRGCAPFKRRVHGKARRATKPRSNGIQKVMPRYTRATTTASSTGM